MNRHASIHLALLPAPVWRGTFCHTMESIAQVCFTLSESEEIGNTGNRFLITNNHTDYDECEENTHSCNHFCLNTPGSYLCGCANHSYKLASDNRTCQGILLHCIENSGSEVLPSCISRNIDSQ